MSFTVNINGQDRSVDLPGDMPLLWVLRDELGLTGTKFGCGIAACGACTVHVDGTAVRSCSVPASSMQGMKIMTIEGLAPKEQPHPLQAAWIAHQVPQCGYCQSGQIMAAAALLKEQPKISRAEAAQGMAGNICRCACYNRIGDAVAEVAAKLGGTGNARA